jgi:hypothetical protein
VEVGLVRESILIVKLTPAEREESGVKFRVMSSVWEVFVHVKVVAEFRLQIGVVGKVIWDGNMMRRNSLFCRGDGELMVNVRSFEAPFIKDEDERSTCWSWLVDVIVTVISVLFFVY